MSLQSVQCLKSGVADPHSAVLVSVRTLALALVSDGPPAPASQSCIVVLQWIIILTYKLRIWERCKKHVKELYKLPGSQYSGTDTLLTFQY